MSKFMKTCIYFSLEFLPDQNNGEPIVLVWL